MDDRTTPATVIVTGASSGLGAAIAYQLGRLGSHVVITARTEDHLRQTQQRVEATGSRVHLVVGDLTQADTIQRVIESTMEQFGAIDGVVNNAGTLDPIQRVGDGKMDDWRYAFDVNFFAPLQLIQAALPYLRQSPGRGRIINVSSGAAVKSYPTWGAYGATKAALNHLTATISAEEPEITTIALRPGVVDTPMQRKIREEGADRMPQMLYDRFSHLHESGQLLYPDQPGLAAAVLALHAPPDWSGNFMNWDHEFVRRLVERTDPDLARPAGV